MKSLRVSRFWDWEMDHNEFNTPSEFVLPSDSNNRNDLKCMLFDDLDKGQVFKEEYEKIQRKEAALRKNNN